jgi:hypothetical protein
MLQEVLLLMVMFGFAYAARKIDTIILFEIEETERLVRNSSITSIQDAITKSRKSSLDNMWMIIYTMVFCAFFDFCYSVCVFIFYSLDCTPQRIPWWLDSTFKFMDRFIAYYLWLYPLLWIFWPSIRRVDEQKRYDRANKYLNSNSSISSSEKGKIRVSGDEITPTDPG